MKVIKKGKGWTIRRDCTGRGHGNGGCGALLEFGKDDVFKHITIMGMGKTNFAFECPECGAITDLAVGDVPKRFFDEVRTRDDI